MTSSANEGVFEGVKDRYAGLTVSSASSPCPDDNRILVVEERFATAAHWKLPGGYVDPGEGLAEAAVREIREETGIETEFRSIVAFRHGHNFNFGCSDIYIVVALKPLSEAIHTDQKEIAKCQWMPLQEYAVHPLVTPQTVTLQRSTENRKRLAHP